MLSLLKINNKDSKLIIIRTEWSQAHLYTQIADDIFEMDLNIMKRHDDICSIIHLQPFHGTNPPRRTSYIIVLLYYPLETNIKGCVLSHKIKVLIKYLNFKYILKFPCKLFIPRVELHE